MGCTSIQLIAFDGDALGSNRSSPLDPREGIPPTDKTKKSKDKFTPPDFWEEENWNKKRKRTDAEKESLGGDGFVYEHGNGTVTEHEISFCDKKTAKENTYTVMFWNIEKKLLKTRQDDKAYQEFLNVLTDRNADLILLAEVTKSATEIVPRDITKILERTNPGSDYKVYRSKKLSSKERMVAIVNEKRLEFIPRPDEELNVNALNPPSGSSLKRKMFLFTTRIKQKKRHAATSKRPATHESQKGWLVVHTTPYSSKKKNLEEMQDVMKMYDIALEKMRETGGLVDDPDLFLIGDLNVEPREAAMIDTTKKLYPMLRKNWGNDRTNVLRGSSYVSNKLADNILIPPTAIEDVVTAGIVYFDSNPKYVPYAGGADKVSDHRPIWLLLCDSNDSDPSSL